MGLTINILRKPTNLNYNISSMKVGWDGQSGLGRNCSPKKLGPNRKIVSDDVMTLGVNKITDLLLGERNMLIVDLNGKI